MTAFSAVAAVIARAWVRLYTAGMEAELRSCRRDEIASDIWEHVHRAPPGNAGGEVLLRCALGAPADISWRLENSDPAGAFASLLLATFARIEGASHWIARRGLPGLTVAVAALYLLGGAFLVLTLPLGQHPNPRAVAIVGGWGIIAGAMLLQGWRALRHHPRAGSALALAGAVPFGLLLVQTVVAPVLTALVAWTVVRRARAVAR